MAEPRKASDILVNLEAEVKSLKGIVNLQDFLLKKILGSCNKTNTILETLIENQQLSPEQKSIIKEIIQPKEISNGGVAISAGFPIEVEKDFKGQRRITRGLETPSTKATNADIEFKDYMAQRKKPAISENLKPKQSDQMVKSEKKVPVTQRVQDNNKKDVFAATVDLSSSDGSVVIKTKTNAMGKWQAQLPPGKYTVIVTKMNAALQKKIETRSEIMVSNSNSAIELPLLIINRE